MIQLWINSTFFLLFDKENFFLEIPTIPPSLDSPHPPTPTYDEWNFLPSYFTSSIFFSKEVWSTKYEFFKPIFIF